MKGLFVWDSDYPWDIRVSKICQTLISNGVEMHLVCRNKFRRPNEEIYGGIYLHRIPSIPVYYGKLNDILGFPLFFSPLWLNRIYTMAKLHSVNFIIVRDLPMALAAVAVGKARKIPVILDMAECYPELIRLIWRFEPIKIANYIVRNPFIADIVEQIVINTIDHIWVMIEESRVRLLRKGVHESKISIVSNTPVYKRFVNATPSFPGTMRKHEGDLVLLYVGFVNFSRGLDTVIESLSILVQKKKNVVLIIIGTGTAEQNLKDKAKALHVENNVEFEGWIDNDTIPEYILSSDICLVPHHKCSHWGHTIPNKLFDYMAAGKPVLVSDVAPMERIVTENDCGLVFRSGSAESLAKNLVGLTDRELRDKLGQNGKRAVYSEYNWDKDSLSMLDSLKRLYNNV